MLIIRGRMPKPNTVMRDNACPWSKALKGSAHAWHYPLSILE